MLGLALQREPAERGGSTGEEGEQEDEPGGVGCSLVRTGGRGGAVPAESVPVPVSPWL